MPAHFLNLRGQVALVTGAGQGIGAATARAFAGAGASVVLVGRRPSPLVALARELTASGQFVTQAVCDVADEAQVNRLVDETLTTFGAIDVLVNNAGVIGQGRLDELTLDDWDAVLDVNLRGAMLCSRAALPGMRARQRGVVVNMASISGQTGGLSANAPYAASKGGLIAFTKALARQMAPWGRANAVAPGQIDTSMGTLSDEQTRVVTAQAPLRRLGTPDEVAACVLFLASPAASYVTGHTLDVNGGLLMG